ncbi:hypothetical protein PH7735_03226 [Shimia thalassica]|uniref:Uncharacterized protein n=1 Tax=Shimia thalassica TaxID=1715693 RepID=A0A0P1IEE4_9RHOB|nr:hypothetical protein [Shimia thalassica]CUK08301.1 hypothetical protein PH7735_03226 [Shimia thalassica]
MKHFAFLLALVAFPLSAETVTPPEGCEPTATVHRDSCIATTYFSCGDETQVVSYARGKVTDTHTFGPDWDLLGYVADNGRSTVSAKAGSKPEASLQAALETGESIGARDMEMTTGVLKGNLIEMQSKLLLGTESVILSGKAFRTGTLERKFTVKKNGVTSDYSFDILAAEDGSMLIEGAAEVDQFGRKSELEWTPRRIAWPGEDGFMTMQSEFGCDG